MNFSASRVVVIDLGVGRRHMRQMRHVSMISGSSLSAEGGAPACFNRLLMFATPWCQRRMCRRRRVRRTTASLALCRRDIDRPRSNEVQSRGSSSACVLASTPFGFAVVVVGRGRAIASLQPCSPPSSSVTAAFLRDAGGEEPGGGLGTVAGAPQLREDELGAPPAGGVRPSRASASSSSTASGAGGPGLIVALSSCAVGTRAPRGCRPASVRKRVSGTRHSPITFVCERWSVAWWVLQPSHAHSITGVCSARHLPGSRVCSGSVLTRLRTQPGQSANRSSDLAGKTWASMPTSPSFH